MVEYPPPLHVDDACDILEVTTTDAMESLRDSDYHGYAMLAIKAAEKRFREEALLLHPDKATGIAAPLRLRCEEAMKYLENCLEAIKNAFQAHVVPGVAGARIRFGLSRSGQPKLIVSWDMSATLETTVEVLPGSAHDVGLQRTYPPEVDTCVVCFVENPELFKRGDCELQLYHTGIDGPQVDLDSSATRVLCEVPDSIHRSARKLEIKKEIERLKAEKRKYEAPIGAAPKDSCKRGRFAPTPPCRRSGTW